ncbi:MAG: hypothetical protein IT306_29185 [Chloroflexi bacterium]|nr:hypothetical protein [Chloroflexota bacterium]
MRTWTRAVGAALLLVGLTASQTFAWPHRLDGRPEQLEIGGDSAYYIWTDGENDFHLATTGPGPERRFVAVIHTNGEFEDIDQIRLEDGDSYELLDGGQKLIVRFQTVNHLDSIQWKVRGGAGLTFDLRVDGHPIRPNNIYLGHEGYHPFGPIFRIAR